MVTKKGMESPINRARHSPLPYGEKSCGSLQEAGRTWTRSPWVFAPTGSSHPVGPRTIPQQKYTFNLGSSGLTALCTVKKKPNREAPFTVFALRSALVTAEILEGDPSIMCIPKRIAWNSEGEKACQSAQIIPYCSRFH